MNCSVSGVQVDTYCYKINAETCNKGLSTTFQEARFFDYQEKLRKHFSMRIRASPVDSVGSKRKTRAVKLQKLKTLQNCNIDYIDQVKRAGSKRINSGTLNGKSYL